MTRDESKLLRALKKYYKYICAWGFWSNYIELNETDTRVLLKSKAIYERYLKDEKFKKFFFSVPLCNYKKSEYYYRLLSLKQEILENEGA